MNWLKETTWTPEQQKPYEEKHSELLITQEQKHVELPTTTVSVEEDEVSVFDGQETQMPSVPLPVPEKASEPEETELRSMTKNQLTSTEVELRTRLLNIQYDFTCTDTMLDENILKFDNWFHGVNGNDKNLIGDSQVLKDAIKNIIDSRPYLRKKYAHNLDAFQALRMWLEQVEFQARQDSARLLEIEDEEDENDENFCRNETRLLGKQKSRLANLKFQETRADSESTESSSVSSPSTEPLTSSDSGL